MASVPRPSDTAEAEARDAVPGSRDELHARSVGDDAFVAASAVVARWLAIRLRLQEPVNAWNGLATRGTRMVPPRRRQSARIWLVPPIMVIVGASGIPEAIQAATEAVLAAIPLPVICACLVIAGRTADLALRRLGDGQPPAVRPVAGPPPPPLAWPALSRAPGSPTAAARRRARTRTPGPGTTARRRTSRGGSRPAGTRGPRPRTA